MVSSSRCPQFSKRIITWCTRTPEPNRFNSISNILSTVTLVLLFGHRAIQGHSTLLHSCLSVNSSSSKCSFMTPIQVSKQPSGSYLYHLGFLSTFLDFSLLRLVQDNFLRKVSWTCSGVRTLWSLLLHPVNDPLDRSRLWFEAVVRVAGLS